MGEKSPRGNAGFAAFGGVEDEVWKPCASTAHAYRRKDQGMRSANAISGASRSRLRGKRVRKHPAGLEWVQNTCQNVEILENMEIVNPFLPGF